MLFAALATITYAQTDDKGYQEGAWVLKGVTGLNMSQTAMANWSAGGENSIAGNAYLNASLTHKKGNWLWVTNMVLDALFIAVFKWGVAGAALATGLSQCVGGVLPLVYFLQPNTSLLRLSPTRLRIRPILAACGNGSSELMSNISSSLVSMLYNFQLMRLAGEDGVSTYGVLMYVQFIFISLFVGYSIGCAPVVGYHYGAQNHGELKNLLGKSALLMGGSGVVLTALAMALAQPMAHLFVGYDAGLFALTVHAFRLFAWSFLLAGFNIFTSGFFTALNNGAVSAAISFLRTLVFQSASVLILPVFFGVDGIWWAITVAEVFAFLISGMFLLRKRNKYHYM